MKKIIFVGGTSRSGSTLLDVILANDPQAMSLGEIYALFWPTRKHHFEERERLQGDPVWSQLLKGGTRNLYSNLIRLFPEIEIFVDSSKDPYWIRYHDKRVRGHCRVEHVLIYKSPAELAKSFIKRGQRTEWIGFYTFYHRLYLTMIRQPSTIAYRDLVTDTPALERLCETTGIPYFEGKKNYWERRHLTFFGSNSIRGEETHNVSGQLREVERRELKYDGSLPEEITAYVEEKLKESPMLETVFHELQRYDVNMDEVEGDSNLKSLSLLRILRVGVRKKLLQTYHYFHPQDFFGDAQCKK